MSSPAFQLMGSRFGETESFYGTSAYGTTPYGGSGYTPYVLPGLAPGSDRLDKKHRRIHDEVVNRRNGVIIGARERGRRGVWKLVLTNLTEAQLEQFKTFDDARRFYLLQDGNPDGPKITVRIREGEFHPVTKRGGFYDLTFEIEELPQ